MKANRRTILGFVVVASVLIAAAAFFSFLPSLPYRAAYNRITLGISAEEADRLVSELPQPAGLHLMRGPPTSVDWEGLVDAEHLYFHVHGPAIERLDEKDDPVLGRSRVVKLTEKWVEDQIRPGVALLKDKDSEQVMAKEWTYEREILLLVFDTQGKVVEKAHVGCRRPFLGWDRAVAWLDEHWPF